MVCGVYLYNMVVPFCPLEIRMLDSQEHVINKCTLYTFIPSMIIQLGNYLWELDSSRVHQKDNKSSIRYLWGKVWLILNTSAYVSYQHTPKEQNFFFLIEDSAMVSSKNSIHTHENHYISSLMHYWNYGHRKYTLIRIDPNLPVWW